VPGIYLRFVVCFLKSVFKTLMPRLPRFFISPERVSGSSITITGEDVRHIATVLRMKPGETLLLSDGAGTDYTARIADMSRTEIRTEVIGRSSRELLSPRITLVQGLPKSDKMDFIIQKATELGAFSIVPVVTERTVVKLRDEEKRIARWQKIAREAAMQSNRPDIPQVMPVQDYRLFLASLVSGAETLLLLPWEEATGHIRNILRQHPRLKDIVVMIGPEGGFSAQEADSARQRGFHAVSLGPNILRTETAAVAVLSMISYELFDEVH
jgi:16S rRNA (uracil1498-N3)-methyltransferase